MSKVTRLPHGYQTLGDEPKKVRLPYGYQITGTESKKERYPFSHDWVGDQVWPSAYDPKLIAAWDLDETSGNREDLVASYDLVDQNTVGYRLGKSGNAASFIATSSEYFTCPGLPIPDAMALSLWVKPDIATEAGTIQIIAGYQTATAYPANAIIWNGGLIGAWYFTDGGEGGSGVYYANTVASLSSWTHVVLISENFLSELYINGVLQTQNASYIGSLDFDPTHTFVVGKKQTSYFDGGLWKMYLWHSPGFSDAAARLAFVTALYNKNEGTFYTPPS